MALRAEHRTLLIEPMLTGKQLESASRAASGSPPRLCDVHDRNSVAILGKRMSITNPFASISTVQDKIIELAPDLVRRQLGSDTIDQQGLGHDHFTLAYVFGAVHAMLAAACQPAGPATALSVYLAVFEKLCSVNAAADLERVLDALIADDPDASAGMAAAGHDVEEWDSDSTPWWRLQQHRLVQATMLRTAH